MWPYSSRRVRRYDIDTEPHRPCNVQCAVCSANTTTASFCISTCIHDSTACHPRILRLRALAKPLHDLCPLSPSPAYVVEQSDQARITLTLTLTTLSSAPCAAADTPLNHSRPCQADTRTLRAPIVSRLSSASFNGSHQTVAS